MALPSWHLYQQPATYFSYPFRSNIRNIAGQYKQQSLHQNSYSDDLKQSKNLTKQNRQLVKYNNKQRIYYIIVMSNSFDYLFKFIMIGDSNVGKSCMLLRFTQGAFKSQHQPTLGVQFGSRTLKINDYDIKIQIWDTAGQQSFKAITRSYYKGSIAALIVYDISKRDSFDNIHKWLNEVRTHSTEKVEVVLVGNKLDLQSRREIPTQQAQKFAKKNGFDFYQVSSKTGQNVDKVFKQVASKIVKRIQRGQINPQTQSSNGVRPGSRKKPKKPSNVQLSKKYTTSDNTHSQKQQCYC